MPIMYVQLLGKKKISYRAFYRYKDFVKNLNKSKFEKNQKIVVKAIFDYYKKINIHPDEHGILNVDVIYNGTWMTRGHSSLIGVGSDF